MIDRVGQVWEMRSGQLYLLTAFALIPNTGAGYGWRVFELCGPTSGKPSMPWNIMNESWLTEYLTRFA